MIDADFDPRGDRLTDPVGKAADLADPGAAEGADDPLHLRNQIALQRVEGQCRGAQHRVLHEHEKQDRQQGAGLRNRHGKRLADKPADRLQLGGHHGDDLPGRGPVEMVQREAQQALEQLVAQAAQHAFAQLPLFDVDMQLEPAVDQDQRQKNPAKHQQIRDLLELEPQKMLREMLAGYRPIDDDLGQIKRIVKKREREQGHDDDIDLLAPTIAQDEPVDFRFEPIGGAQRQRPAQPAGHGQSTADHRGGGGTQASYQPLSVRQADVPLICPSLDGNGFRRPAFAACDPGALQNFCHRRAIGSNKTAARQKRRLCYRSLSGISQDVGQPGSIDAAFASAAETTDLISAPVGCQVGSDRPLSTSVRKLHEFG